MSLLLNIAQKYKKPLPDEETRELVRQAQQGDAKARDRLIRQNVRFVLSVCHRYYAKPGSWDDMLQAGCMGLNKAIDKYDFRSGVRFLSYAVHWIRAGVQKVVFADVSLINAGTTQARRSLLCSMTAIIRKLEDMGREPTPEAIVKMANRRGSKTKVKLSDVHAVQALMKGELSIHNKVRGTDGEQDHLSHMVHPGSAPDEELAANEDQEERERLTRIGLAALDPREQEIFHARFLADTDNGRSAVLQELGDHFGFSRERARQLEIRGREKFTQAVEDEMGKLNGHDAMQERLSRIAKKDAKERHCPKCKRDNALRRDFVDGRFVYKCRWRDCQAITESS